jgi:uncharacterized membrane protein YraQ (UPF0718 family)
MIAFLITVIAIGILVGSIYLVAWLFLALLIAIIVFIFTWDWQKAWRIGKKQATETFEKQRPAPINTAPIKKKRRRKKSISNYIMKETGKFLKQSMREHDRMYNPSKKYRKNRYYR